MGDFIMKLNYPIVYALMPIIEPAGWVHGLNELERQYDTACYIVSKCFLIGEKITYQEDGKKGLTYEVVFPYQKGTFYWEYEAPSYNLIHGQCMNSIYVDAIFDSYDDAKKYKDEKNQVLCQKAWISLPYTENFRKIKEEKEQEFYNKIKKYELLERQLLLNLTKLNNEKRRELDPVISFEKGVLPFQLYEFIRFCNGQNYLVYSVKKDQYDLLRMSYQEKSNPLGTLDIQDARPLLLSDSHSVRLISSEKNGCYYFDDHWLKYSEEMPAVTQAQIASISQDIMTFYTTETDRDIIDSYESYPGISLTKLLKKKSNSKK